MPRVNRKRKNVPQRKPKPIKFNQNEIESERKSVVAVAVDAAIADTVDVNVVADDAINQTDVIAHDGEGDNLTLEGDDIIADDDDDRQHDEITSKLKMEFFFVRLSCAIGCKFFFFV